MTAYRVPPAERTFANVDELRAALLETYAYATRVSGVEVPEFKAAIEALPDLTLARALHPEWSDLLIQGMERLR